MRSNIFDRLSFLSLFLVIILLPFFFLPFTNIPIEIGKGLLLVVGLALSIIFWGFARFFDGKISLPKSVCLLSGAGVVLAFFLSSVFSKASQVSLFGTMFDIGTFWFIFACFLLMLMSSIILGSPKRAKMVLFGAIISGAVVLIFQSVHLFLPGILSLGVLVGKTENVLGSWNALGLFAGFSALMSLFIVEFFSTTRMEKWLLRILIILSIIFVAVVNFPFVWELLGISSLIIFVYKISLTSKEQQKQSEEKDTRSASGKRAYFPAFSFTIIMITLLFFMSGQFIGGILPSRLGLSNNEISPSFPATMQVTKSVLKENPIFGIGPNKFAAAWAGYKPGAINSTAFWDVSFNSGSGLLPTFASTTGYLGILALLVFFTLLVGSGIKSIFSGIKNGVNWETMAFFVLSLYLFIACFFYSTGLVIFLLAFAFTGVFIGLSASSRHKGEISISFLNDPRKSFFSILCIILIIIISAALSFKYMERFASVSYFERALSASTVPAAEDSIGKALKLYTNDLYLRTYAQVYLVKLNSIANKGGNLSDTDKSDSQASLDQAVLGAQAATQYDPTNYLNFQSLGSVYQTAILFGVKDVYSKAIEAYTAASVLNPLNPGLKLDMASASFADGKTKEAKDYANAALTLKPDYIDALIVLSQIAKSEGDSAGALLYAERALSLAPTNQDLMKYADSIKNPNSSNTAVPSNVDTSSNTTSKTPDNSTKKKP